MGYIDDFLKVKSSTSRLSQLDNEQKNKILTVFAKKLTANIEHLIDENLKDISSAKEMNIQEQMIDRLALNSERIQSMADAIMDIVKLDDPIGRILEERVLSNGVDLKKVTVPLGVIGIIYEARPNVTADSIALCIKSGNACILKGGKEAIHSNTAIAEIFNDTLRDLGYNEVFVHLIKDTTRETTQLLMKSHEHVDVLIPRGGIGLIKYVVENSTVPVIETGAGNCHTFVDKSADFEMAIRVVDNAKTQRPSVCNSLETLLIHNVIAEDFLPLISKHLSNKEVELRGCDVCIKILGSEMQKADESDYYAEFNELILAIKIVDDVKDAVKHINKYSTSHSDAIITASKENAEYFLNNVDSAAVYVNASTRFTDGGVYGLGAEIGISTQKLHARGPMGLNELTSYKYKLIGNGQIR